MKQRAGFGLTLAMVLVGTGALAASQATPAKKAAPAAKTAEAKAPAPAKKAIDVYKEYQAAVKTAKSIKDVLPFLTKEYVRNLSGAPKDMQDRMFEGLKPDAGWQDIAVTSETTKGDILELKTTAKGPDGKFVVGTVAFKNEGGAWKIEGQGWVPDYAKQK